MPSGGSSEGRRALGFEHWAVVVAVYNHPDPLPIVPHVCTPVGSSTHPYIYIMAGGPSASGSGLSGPANKVVAYALTAFAAFGGLLFGYDTGTIKCVTESLQ